MRGERTEFYAKLDEENGYILVTGEKKEFWNAPDTKIEYKANIGLFDEIGNIVIDSKLAKAAKKRLSKDVVLDAASWDLIINFENGKEVRIQSLQELSYEDNQACGKIVEMLENREFEIK